MGSGSAWRIDGPRRARTVRGGHRGTLLAQEDGQTGKEAVKEAQHLGL